MFAHVELNASSPYRTISVLEGDDQAVVLVKTESLVKYPDSLNVFIKEMQSRGYVFVRVSAIQK